MRRNQVKSDPDAGAQRRCFYERTHGKEEAKALAIEARETGAARPCPLRSDGARVEVVGTRPGLCA
jgi:hypothetical protein